MQDSIAEIFNNQDQLLFDKDRRNRINYEERSVINLTKAKILLETTE